MVFQANLSLLQAITCFHSSQHYQENHCPANQHKNPRLSLHPFVYHLTISLPLGWAFGWSSGIENMKKKHCPKKRQCLGLNVGVVIKLSDFFLVFHTYKIVLKLGR
jgi:hypothetical protein